MKNSWGAGGGGAVAGGSFVLLGFYCFAFVVGGCVGFLPGHITKQSMIFHLRPHQVHKNTMVACHTYHLPV